MESQQWVHSVRMTMPETPPPPLPPPLTWVEVMDQDEHYPTAQIPRTSGGQNRTLHASLLSYGQQGSRPRVTVEQLSGHRSSSPPARNIRTDAEASCVFSCHSPHLSMASPQVRCQAVLLQLTTTNNTPMGPVNRPLVEQLLTS